jgi:hypothetical protein
MASSGAIDRTELLVSGSGGERPQGSRERDHVWLVGERAMCRTCGSLSGEGDEAVGIMPRWVSHHSGRGKSGIGEELRFRVRDRPSGSDSVRSEDCSGIRLICAERPPGQCRQHPWVADRRVRLLVTGARGVEQRFCPGQITETPSDCRLADHGIG